LFKHRLNRQPLGNRPVTMEANPTIPKTKAKRIKKYPILRPSEINQPAFGDFQSEQVGKIFSGGGNGFT
jgi:hypothetical protein